MKKNGFTLIELATVVTIMAMIALIATPIVINVIDNVRKGSIEKSVANIEHAAEVYYYNQKMNSAFSGITFKCGGGACRNGDQILTLNGQVPEDGYVKIDKDGNISLKAIEIKGYGCSKETDKYNCIKIKGSETINTNNSLLTFDSELGTISNYKMYGNSGEEIKEVRNLFNPENWQIGKTISGSGVGYKINPVTNAKTATYLYMPMEANTEYTFSINAGTYWIDRIAEMDSSDLCTRNIAFYANRDIRATYTWTTQATTTYIAIEFKRIDGLDLVEEDIKNIRFQLEKGSKVTSYKKYGAAPVSEFPSVGNLVTDSTNTNYGKHEIPIKIVGKNLFNEDDVLAHSKVVKDEEGYKISAYPAVLGSSSNLVPRIKQSLKPGITYTLSRKVERYGLNNSEGAIVIRANSKGVANVNYGNGVVSKVFSLTEEQINNIEQVYIYGNGTTPVLFEYFQLEVGDKATEHEPYREENYSIYLDEPLRCVENVCDYIDYKSSMLVRNVGVNKNGTLYTLSQPTFDDIDLPEIKINKGINNIFINTDISPNNFEIEYYK